MQAQRVAPAAKAIAAPAFSAIGRRTAWLGGAGDFALTRQMACRQGTQVVERQRHLVADGATHCEGDVMRRDREVAANAVRRRGSYRTGQGIGRRLTPWAAPHQGRLYSVKLRTF